MYAGDPDLSIIIPVEKSQEVIQMARKTDSQPQDRYSMTIEEVAPASAFSDNDIF